VLLLNSWYGPGRDGKHAHAFWEDGSKEDVAFVGMTNSKWVSDVMLTWCLYGLFAHFLLMMVKYEKCGKDYPNVLDEVSRNQQDARNGSGGSWSPAGKVLVKIQIFQ
jgi:hypothetical protein